MVIYDNHIKFFTQKNCHEIFAKASEMMYINQAIKKQFSEKHVLIIWSSLSLTYNQVLWNSIYLDINISFVLGHLDPMGVYIIII